MKKIFASLFSGLVCSLLITSQAQTLNVAAEVATDATKEAPALSKANSRALNNFKKNYTDAPDVKWVTEKETISAHMSRDDKRISVVYDKKGRWLRTMYNYNEPKLSKDIRKMVKSVYYDYDITFIQEIHEGQLIFYIIHLDDKTSYKQVAVYEGELVVLKEFNKQM